MTARRARAGHAEVTASIKDRISGGLKRIKAKMISFAATSARIGGNLIGAGAASLTPVIVGLNHFLKSGDRLNKMAARTSVSTEAISTLGFAANETGSDIGTLEKGFIGMTRTVRNAERGLSTASAALEATGITLKDLEGKTPDEQLKVFADGLRGLEEGKRAAVAMEIFGKSGQKLLPMLKLGSEGINELQESARSLGLEVSSSDADSAAVLTDRVFELMEVVKAGAFQVGAALAPSLIKLTTWLVNSAGGVVAFVKSNRGLIETAAKVMAGVVAIGGGFLAISGSAAIASFGVSGLISVLGLAGGIMGAILSPIGLITAGLIGGVGAWLYYSESGNQTVSFLSARLGQLLTWGQAVFGGVYDAIVAGDWSLAGKVLWQSLRVAWATGISWLHALWIDFKFGLLSAFDVLVTGFRSKWNAVTSFIGKGIIWLIDRANAASEALSGKKIIDVDTNEMRRAIDQENSQFQRQIYQDQIKREQSRIQQIEKAKKQLGAQELQTELNQLIQQSKEQRAKFDAELEREKATELQPTELQKSRFQIPTVADAANTGTTTGETTNSLGSFSLSALQAFATRRSVEDRNAAANERTATATESIQESIDDSDGLLVTS